MNGSNVWGLLVPFGDASPCSNGIFIRKKSCFMELRVIAVPVGSEIKKIPNDTCFFFFLFY